MSYNAFLERIIICFALSFLIGLERQYRRRYIGLRTTILVCLGSFLFVSFSFLTMNNDITRIATGVVTGIGFLGAGAILKDGSNVKGVILKDKGNIKGLDTAATLWCDAAIGILCAGGFIFESLTSTFFILFTNIVLRYINKSLHVKKNEKNIPTLYLIKIICDEKDEPNIRKIIKTNIDNKTLLNSIESVDITSERVQIELWIKILDVKNNNLDKILNKISIHPSVISFSCKQESSILEIDDEEL